MPCFPADEVGRQGFFITVFRIVKMNVDRKLTAFVMFAIMAIIMCACQRPVMDVPVPTREMREVTDDLGRKVVVPVTITRVVSTAPSITEMVLAAGGGDRLVGVTTFCNYPEEAKPIAKIGDTMTPNMETIVAMKPDVVFVSTASQLETFTKTLEQNSITVYVINPASLDELLGDLAKLGYLFGTEAVANSLARDLRRRIDQAYEKAYGPSVWKNVENHQPVPVFVQISKEPLFTIGKESFLTDLLTKADAESVTANVPTAYPKLSKETATGLAPFAIILSESPDNQEPNEAFRNSPAVKNGRVYKINADILSRPGPRLVDALEQIARYLHPDKF